MVEFDSSAFKGILRVSSPPGLQMIASAIILNLDWDIELVSIIKHDYLHIEPYLLKLIRKLDYESHPVPHH